MLPFHACRCAQGWDCQSDGCISGGGAKALVLPLRRGSAVLDQGLDFLVGFWPPHDIATPLFEPDYAQVAFVQHSKDKRPKGIHFLEAAGAELKLKAMCL